MYTINTNKLINDILASQSAKATTHAAVNIYEQDNAFTLKVAAPGLNKEDFNIQSENGILTIEVSKKQEEDVKYFKQEFSFHAFKRSFRLPKNVDLTKIEASYKNGILAVALPKVAEMQPKKIEVLVN